MWVIVAVMLVTAALAPFQFVAVWRRRAAMRHIPMLYHRVLGRLIGLRIVVHGEPERRRPLLVVSNHVSWLDIVALSAHAQVAFVAKREVASWPLIGRLARMQGSVFVDRGRRLESATASREIAEKICAGEAVVLFAEGTSSDGMGVLPFRSALIGAAAAALSRDDRQTAVLVQPLAISYPCRSRQVAAWYGEMAFVPHLLEVIRAGRIDAVISWGAPIAFVRGSDRKDVTRRLEEAVRRLKAGHGPGDEGAADQAA